MGMALKREQFVFPEPREQCLSDPKILRDETWEWETFFHFVEKSAKILGNFEEKRKISKPIANPALIVRSALTESRL